MLLFLLFSVCVCGFVLFSGLEGKTSGGEKGTGHVLFAWSWLVHSGDEWSWLVSSGWPCVQLCEHDAESIARVRRGTHTHGVRIIKHNPMHSTVFQWQQQLEGLYVPPCAVIWTSRCTENISPMSLRCRKLLTRAIFSMMRSLNVVEVDGLFRQPWC